MQCGTRQIAVILPSIEVTRVILARLGGMADAPFETRTFPGSMETMEINKPTPISINRSILPSYNIQQCSIRNFPEQSAHENNTVSLKSSAWKQKTAIYLF
jgi:hypothetical protein